MIKLLTFFLLIIAFNVFFLFGHAYATSGCCSWHGGVSGCSSSGRQVCNDGTLSPSCTCAPAKAQTSTNDLKSNLLATPTTAASDCSSEKSEIDRLNKTVDSYSGSLHDLQQQADDRWDWMWYLGIGGIILALITYSIGKDS